MIKKISKSIEFRLAALAVLALTLLSGSVIVMGLLLENGKANIAAFDHIHSLQKYENEQRMAIQHVEALAKSAESSEFHSAARARGELKHELHAISANSREQKFPKSETASIEPHRKIRQRLKTVLTSYSVATSKVTAALTASEQLSANDAAALDAATAMALKELADIDADLSDTLNAAIGDVKQSYAWTVVPLLAVFFSGIVLVAAVAIFFKKIVSSARSHSTALEGLANDDWSVKVSGSDVGGELGDVTNAIVRLQEKMRTWQANDAKYAEAHENFLSSFVVALQNFSDGDLRFRINEKYSDEYEPIRQTFNEAAEKVEKSIATIVVRAAQLREGSSRMLSASDELSRHTEEQASSLEETSASMEEMAATVRQTANNAVEASKSANSMLETATVAGDVTSKAVRAMEKIENSSKQVTDIVDLIEDIAFQTNILALNAAVEAARAGDSGKGFAVVANEVRALSQRSSQALKDVKELIDSSNHSVAEGVDLVRRAENSLAEIAGSTETAANLVREIASASQEQAAGIEQVTTAVTSMDHMTQQNAALVQETTAALHSAQSGIQHLDEIVSNFRTKNEEDLLDEDLLEKARQPLALHAKTGATKRDFPTAKQPVERTTIQGNGTSDGATALDAGWTEF